MRYFNRKALWLVGLVAVAAAGFALRGLWWPPAQRWVQQLTGRPETVAEDAHDDEHAEDEHEHEGHSHAHDEATSIELSPQARLNLGLTRDQLQPVQLEEYSRSISVPALVVPRPGRTYIEVSAPLTGVVTAVHVVPGSAVTSGDLLFEMRLTHEDVVQAQVEFLRTLSELDVETAEIERLRPLVDRGALAATVMRDREYAKAKLEALLGAQRESLRLHGLTEAQVDGIADQRRLLRKVSIFVPSRDMSSSDELQLTGAEVTPAAFSGQRASEADPPLIVQDLKIHRGEALTAGTTMCTLADYGELYIEGAAFEQDAIALSEAVANGWTVDALFNEPGLGFWTVPDLTIVYLANEVDVESRTLHFYVDLPNEIVRDANDSSSVRFMNWRYRPGQRLQLRVPVETWQQQIVLPVDAVATEGAEHYVFIENGGHFDRVPVHVRYRDQSSVVIANDGAIFPGDVVARRSAHQMLMAIKNKAGGGVDPHAGHNH